MVWVDILISVVTGLALWAFLPRGVVLTRSRSAEYADTWKVKNDSALPVKVISARVLAPGVDTSLPPDGVPGVSLRLDDAIAEIAREDRQAPWDQVVIAPGDTLTAVVGTNTSLRIDYRRAGWMGLLERRQVTINGEA